MQAVHGHALDVDRQRERMNKRAAKLKKMSMAHIQTEDADPVHSPLKSVRSVVPRLPVGPATVNRVTHFNYPSGIKRGASGSQEIII